MSAGNSVQVTIAAWQGDGVAGVPRRARGLVVVVAGRVVVPAVAGAATGDQTQYRYLRLVYPHA
jgi:hypothetical protein